VPFLLVRKNYQQNFLSVFVICLHRMLHLIANAIYSLSANESEPMHLTLDLPKISISLYSVAPQITAIILRTNMFINGCATLCACLKLLIGWKCSCSVIVFNTQELHFQPTLNSTIVFFIKYPLLVFHAFDLVSHLPSIAN
jgi:hypothetical protein